MSKIPYKNWANIYWFRTYWASTNFLLIWENEPHIFLIFQQSEPRQFLSNFLIFREFQPQLSYKVVSYKKKLSVNQNSWDFYHLIFILNANFLEGIHCLILNIKQKRALASRTFNCRVAPINLNQASWDFYHLIFRSNSNFWKEVHC